MKILVTGGARFIGSCFVRLALQDSSTTTIVNVDKLSYAGNLKNLGAVAHFTIESNVDRSIFWPQPVFETNLRGTFNRLASIPHLGQARSTLRRRVWAAGLEREILVSFVRRFQKRGNFICRDMDEQDHPSGSDAGARHHFRHLDGLEVSNSYGPRQLPEYLIPLMISNALENKPAVYGEGMQVRDWLDVKDQRRAPLGILKKGRDGEIYNIGGNRPSANRWVIEQILGITGKPSSLTPRCRTDRVTTVGGAIEREALEGSRLEPSNGCRARG